MMKSKFYVLLAAVLVFAFIPKSDEPVDTTMVDKIKNESLNNSHMESLAFHLTDYLGPRLSGSSNLRRARAWTADQFTKWGLTNVRIDSYGDFGRGWNIKKSYIAMTEPYYSPLIALPKAWTDGMEGPVSSEVIMVDVSSEEELAQFKGKLKGKIVMMPTTLQVVTTFEPEARRFTDDQLENFRNPAPQQGGNRGQQNANPEALERMRQQRALAAAVNQFFLDEGAALKITGTRGSFGTVFHSAGGSYSVDKKKTLPEMEMSMEHFGRIQRLIKNGHTVKLDADYQVEWLDDDYKGYNVLADIAGTDPNLKEEIVMLGAHLDSWHAGTGANDNGAGVMVMMEAVRILKELGFQPRRTIRIALWGEEEQGLYGSRGYIQKYVADRQTFEKKGEWDKISAYYNIDNGSGKIRGINLQGIEALAPIFSAWFEPFHEMGANTISLRSVGSTDHVAFDAVGVPGFQFIQDPIDYGRGYHTNMDTYERLQIDDMKQMAAIVASLVYHTAQRDEKLPRKPWGNGQ
jgi:carboxypeptidase Q